MSAHIPAHVLIKLLVKLLGILGFAGLSSTATATPAAGPAARSPATRRGSATTPRGTSAPCHPAVGTRPALSALFAKRGVVGDDVDTRHGTGGPKERTLTRASPRLPSRPHVRRALRCPASRRSRALPFLRHVPASPAHRASPPDRRRAPWRRASPRASLHHHESLAQPLPVQTSCGTR